MKRGPGRPPLKAEERRSEPVGIRLTKATRDKLEKARRGPEGDKTLSQEIEQRLRRSFELDEELTKRFGSPGTYALFRMMANGIALVEANCVRGDETRERSWLHNRFVFDQVKALINVMLNRFKPEGRRVRPKHLEKQFAEEIGQLVALYQLQGLEIDDPELRRQTRVDSANLANAAILLKRFLKGSPARSLKQSMDKHVKAWLKKQKEERE